MALPWPLWYLEACRVLSYPGNPPGSLPNNSSNNNNNSGNNNNNNNNTNNVNNNNNVGDHHQHFLGMMQKMAYHHHQQQQQQQQQQQIIKQQKFNEEGSIKSGDDDDDDEDDDNDEEKPENVDQPPGNKCNDDGFHGNVTATSEDPDKSNNDDGDDEDDEDDDYAKRNGSGTKAASNRSTSNDPTIIAPSTPSYPLTNSGEAKNPPFLPTTNSSSMIGDHDITNDVTSGSKRRKQPRKSVQRDPETFFRDDVTDRYHSDEDRLGFTSGLPRLKRELRDDFEEGGVNNDQSDWGEFQNGGKGHGSADVGSGSPKIQSRRLGLLAHHGLVPSSSRVSGSGGGKQMESMNQISMEEQNGDHNGDGGHESSESTRSEDLDEEDENKALYGLLRNPAFNPWAFPETMEPTCKDAGRNGLDIGDSPGTSSLSLMDRRFMPSPPLSPGSQHHHHHHHHNNNNQQQWTYEEQFKQLYELSDDPKRKDFLDDLFSFMQKRGTPVNRIPIMAKQTLDLYELFQLVVSKGGLVEVINKKLWREITKGLNLPSSITSAAFTLRTQYMKYLYPYECERLKLSTLNELQYAVDGNRREGRRPGGFGEEAPRGPSMPSLISPIQNHSLPSMLSHLNPSMGFQDSLSALSRRTPTGPQDCRNNNNKDKEASPNSSPYQHRPPGQRPMTLHPQGHPHQLHQSQMFYPNNHHPNHPLRSFNDGDAVSMATRAMAEMTKRMEDASRFAAVAANQRFVDHLQTTPISSYCLSFKQGKRENTENFSPSPPKQLLLDGNRHQIQTDQSHSIPSINGINIKLTNNGDGPTSKDDSLQASMEINGILYKGMLYPHKKQQQQQYNGESSCNINTNNNTSNNSNSNNVNSNNNNTNNNIQSRDKRPSSPVIDVNEAG